MHTRGMERLLRRYVDATAAWRPLCFHSCTYHVQFLSNRYSSLCMRANTVWKWKFNGYCNECWLGRSERASRKETPRILWGGEVLFRCSAVVGFHEEGMIWGKHDYFIYLFPPSAFPRTQGSRLLQEGRALPRHASLEGFLQATSRLFGCHWDCLKRICFCTRLQGAPHQEKSRSPLSTWHRCYAFVNIKAKRLVQCV